MLNSADLTWGTTLESQVQWGKKKKQRPRGKERRGERKVVVFFKKKIVRESMVNQD